MSEASRVALIAVFARPELVAACIALGTPRANRPKTFAVAVAAAVDSGRLAPGEAVAIATAAFWRGLEGPGAKYLAAAVVRANPGDTLDMGARRSPATLILPPVVI